MNFLKNELRAGELAPILLGDSAFAKSVSRRFFNRYGLISHIFCERIPFLRRFCLTAKYHCINGFDRDELLWIALKDFASGLQSRDIVLYLIPCTKDAAQFIERYRERLEPEFVIAGAQSFAELLEK